MVRTLEANHTLGQQQNSRTPYIYMIFTSKDGLTTYDLSTDSIAYGNRILMIDHTEEPYNDYAYIMLRNNDRLIPDLKGYYTNIGYGDTYSGSNYYSGGLTSRLWVKEQRLVSAGGRLYTLLVLEGIWSFFREQFVIGSITEDEGYLKRYYDPSYSDTNELHSLTVWDALNKITDLIDAACGTRITVSMDVSVATGQDDDIIDTYNLGDEINAIPYENALDLTMNLMSFTKCFIRVEETQNFEIRYPRDTEAADHTYYSYQQHYFYSYTYNDGLVIPNHIYVVCGQDADGNWPDEATVKALMGEDLDQDSIDAYMDVSHIYIAGYIQSKADADTRADAIMYKVAAQRLQGQLVIPHDASVELYDKIEVIDTRGQ